MMKKVLSVILALVLACSAALIFVSAEVEDVILTTGAVNRLVDNAGLLNDTEAGQISAALNEASSNTGADLAVITVKNLADAGYEESGAYIEEMCGKNGFGENGLVMCYESETDIWYLRRIGTVEWINLNSFDCSFESLLTEKKYADAFAAFISAYNSDYDSYKALADFDFFDIDSKKPRAVDAAGLLDDIELATLNTRLDELSKALGFDILVLTVSDFSKIESYDGKYYTNTEAGIQAFADDYMDYNWFEYANPDKNDPKIGDGALLVISMAERDWYISTKGEGIRAVDHDLAFEEFGSYVSSGQYKAAFIAYANYCNDAVTDSRSFHLRGKIIISLLV